MPPEIIKSIPMQDDKTIDISNPSISPFSGTIVIAVVDILVVVFCDNQLSVRLDHISFLNMISG